MKYFTQSKLYKPKIKEAPKRKVKSMTSISNDILDKEDSVKLHCMSNIKRIVQKTVKERGLTREEYIKSFGLKRRNDK